MCDRSPLLVRANTPTHRRLTIETTYDLNDDKSHTAPSVTKTVLVLGIWPLTAAKSPALTEISSRGSVLRARSARLCRFCPNLAMRFSPYVRAARRRERRTRPRLRALWQADNSKKREPRGVQGHGRGGG